MTNLLSQSESATPTFLRVSVLGGQVEVKPQNLVELEASQELGGGSRVFARKEPCLNLEPIQFQGRGGLKS